MPLIGHAWQLAVRPLEFMASLPAHGDLAQVKLGPWPAYVVCHPDLLHKVLVEDGNYDKGGPVFDKVRELVGNSLASCPHADHRRQRRMVQPAFRRDRLARYAEIMTEQIATVMTTWRPEQVVDVRSAMLDFSMTVATRALFARDTTNELALAELQSCLRDIVNGIARRVLMPLAVLDRIPTPGNRRFARAGERVWQHTRQLIAESRSAGAEHDDLLSVLMAARDRDGRGFSDRELRDQVVMFVSAAGETTANALCWSWHLLGRHPDIRTRLHEEVDEVLGGRLAGYDDLPKLPFTRSVITESLRLYPPAWLFTRVTTRGTELAGEYLPTGTVVVYCPYVVHHRGDLYPDPERFDPDRWAEPKAKALPRGSWVPFGDGPRKCMGDEFAMAQAVLALASIAARWRLDPVAGAPVRPVARTVLAPRSLRMRVRDRADETVG